MIRMVEFDRPIELVREDVLTKVEAAAVIREMAKACEADLWLRACEAIERIEGLKVKTRDIWGQSEEGPGHE